MDSYEKDVVEFLSAHSPYSPADVAWFYQRCGESFDKTMKAMEIAYAKNSRDIGVLTVMDRPESLLSARARLWGMLKSELEAEADGVWASTDAFGHPRIHGTPSDANRSRLFLERMRRMEDRS